jgi:hypothetical protein
MRKERPPNEPSRYIGQCAEGQEPPQRPKPILGYPGLTWTLEFRSDQYPTYNPRNLSMNHIQIDSPIDRDETDAQTFCHLIIKA